MSIFVVTDRTTGHVVGTGLFRDVAQQLAATYGKPCNITETLAGFVYREAA